MVTRAEFASPEWFDVLHQVARAELDPAALGGRSFTFSEEFTEPPVHLLSQQGSLGWHFSVASSVLEIGAGPHPDPDFAVIADYTAVRPMGVLRYADPAEAAQLQRLMASAVAAGKISTKGDPAAMPQAVAQSIAAIHDAMADRTA